MTDTRWINACEALWGEDWIAPLSEVLGVNRRTVERWRSGEVTIPDRIATELIRLPRTGTATRAYGTILRRLARGETLDEISDDIADQRRALARCKADIGRFMAVPILATKWNREGQPKD